MRDYIITCIIGILIVLGSITTVIQHEMRAQIEDLQGRLEKIEILSELMRQAILEKHPEIIEEEKNAK